MSGLILRAGVPDPEMGKNCCFVSTAARLVTSGPLLRACIDKLSNLDASASDKRASAASMLLTVLTGVVGTFSTREYMDVDEYKVLIDKLCWAMHEASLVGHGDDGCQRLSAKIIEHRQENNLSETVDLVFAAVEAVMGAPGLVLVATRVCLIADDLMRGGVESSQYYNGATDIVSASIGYDEATLSESHDRRKSAIQTLASLYEPHGAHLLALGAFNSDQRHYVSLALRNGTWFLFDGPTAKDLGSWDKAVQYLVNKRFVPWEALYEKSNGESAGLPASPKAVMKQAEKRRAPQVVSVEVVRRPRVAAKRSFLTPSQNVRGEQATPAFSSVADTVAEEAPAALCPVPPSMDWDGRHYTIISSDCPDIGIPIRSPAKRSGTRRAAQHDMSGGLLGLFFGPGAVGQGHQAQGRDAHVDGSGRVTLKQGSPVVGPAPSRSLPSKQRRRMPCAVEDSDMEYPHASSAKEGSVLSTWQRHQPARRERNGRFSLTRRPTGGSVTDTDTASLGSPSSSGSSRERWRSADNRFDMLADNLSLLPEAAKEDERLGRDMSSAALPVAPESNHHGQRQHDVFTGRKVSTVLQTSLRRAMSARPALRLRGGGGDPPSSPSSGVDILMAGASTNEAAVDECPRCCKKRQKNWQRSAEGRQGWQWGWQWDGADGAETGPREHGR